MSEKARDAKGRWRSVTIGFRVSPEENAAIDEAVKLSGLTKQEYIAAKLQDRTVVVERSPKTYKALKDKMEQIYLELKRIESAGECTEEFLETIRYVSLIYNEMKDYVG